ncbi:MAG TPA: hypothetical protein VFH73_11500 [Polyangia bacterium]|jgi:hypothetical protein|nr:hypothetical protein [Polyangia bacterium]
MIRTSLLWPLPFVALLLVFSTTGCGGSSPSKPKDAGSGGTSGDGAVGGDVVATDTAGGTGGAGQDGAVADVPGGNDSPGGTGGAAGGTGGGSGGRDGGGDATAGTGGAPGDAGVDTAPARCQAGEACTGNTQCNAGRCIRMEQEVCHCVSGSLFCGPVACTPPMPDGGTSDAPASDGPTERPARDAGVIPTCTAGTSTGDMCVGGTDQLCNTECVNGRTRFCFCNNNRDEWVCSQPTRCP